MNAAYYLHLNLWRAVDLLYPPVCAGCGSPNFRLCPNCYEEINIIQFKFCAFCGKPINGESPLCSDCANTPIFFSAATAWGKYDGVLRNAIHALKFKNDVGLGDFFASQLIDILKEKNWDFDVVIPVPLSRERRKERSYNQSALLSRPIARYFGKKHPSKALLRTIDTGSQIHRNKIDRNLFLEGAFWGNPAKLNGRKVLLVDDIITTGATINHCSSALSEAGASQVSVIAIAKTFRSTQDGSED